MPEYGRNVQKMVEIAINIEDREERNRCARTIVSIMANMFPQQRETADFRNKLWDHLAIISQFKLDVDAPFPLPKETILEDKPERIPYQTHEIKMPHYGHLVESCINKVDQIENPDGRKSAVRDIATYMKKTLLALNKNFATDERLFNDIKALSDGRIEVADGTRTAFIRESQVYSSSITYQTNRKQFQKKNNKQKNKQNQRNRK